MFVLGAVCCRAEDDGASVGESGESTLGDAALQLTKRPATQAVRRRVRVFLQEPLLSVLNHEKKMDIACCLRFSYLRGVRDVGFKYSAQPGRQDTY